MNGGRYGYWKIQNDIMEYLNMVLSDDDYIFILPDDVKLVKGFFEKSINLLDDSGAASINLLNVTDGKLVTQWVNNDVQEVLCNGTLLLTSGYVDMGMVISGKVFKHLGFLSSGFVSSTGSGVGRQYTVKLRRAGQIYQVKHSLLIHGNHESVLNPNERGRNPMVSNQVLPWCRSGNSYTGLKNMNQTHYRK